MVLSILIILFIGVIAFFHYVQGFFSATISAMITVIAAVLAVSYDETVVTALLKGKMADSANAMVLCMIFAVVYIVLRLIFDAAIPGNVRTPSTVDKVGAGLMGIVAGIFVTGIFAIAVQMLPWDPSMSFLDYERFKTVGKKDIIVPVNLGRTQLDSFEYSELKDSSFTPESQQSLYVPVDDWVLDTVYHISDGGSLAGDRPLASVHPDYLTELFGERLGIQTGAKRTTINLNGDPGADVTGLFTVDKLPCFDGQIQELRLKSNYTPLYPLPIIDKSAKQPDQIGKGEVKPGPDQRILIVRVKVKPVDADDADQIVRFSTGSIHLVGRGGPDGKTYKDFFPIGTLENGSAVLLNKPDDFLFAKEDGGFDAVFVVDQSLFTGTKDDIKLADGVSIAIKRLADLNLSGSDVSQSITSDSGSDLQQNPLLTQRLKPYLPPPAPAVASAAPTPSPAPSNSQDRTPARTTPPSNTNPFPTTPTPVTPTPPLVSVPQVQPGKPIASDVSGYVGAGFRAPGLSAVSTAANGNDVTDGPVAGGGTISLTDGKISAAKIDPTKSLSDINQDNSFDHFYCPPSFAMVQVAVHQYQPGWDWIAQLNGTKLVDSNGNTYNLFGYYQLVKTGGTTSLLLRYSSNGGYAAVASSPDGPPASDIYYIFLVKSNCDIKSLSVGGKTQDLSAPVHVP